MMAPMGRGYAEVIGDPVSHSKSPIIHGFWLTRLGIENDYRLCHVRPAELADYLAKRREDAAWRGCNVTIPHKEAIAALVDQRDTKATAIGAVNTVTRHPDGRLMGSNTDVDGVAEAVGLLPPGGKAVIIGAGGAARAAFAFLAAQPGLSARVLARSAERAQRALADCRLEAELLPLESGPNAFEDASLVINATQLGMAGQDAMPAFVLDGLARVRSDALVFDMVYVPLETELLKAARARGLRTADGLAMLIGQAAVAFERFFGVAPPRDYDAALRAKLTS
jgi:shikimate dehydrogenase